MHYRAALLKATRGCRTCSRNMASELNEPKRLEIYTPDEIANLHKLHPSTVRRMFIDEDGVIRIGHPARRGKRQHFTLRIPHHVVERVFGRMTVGADRKAS